MTSSEFLESVLLVEDTQEHAFLIKRELRSFAREVRHAPDIKSALGELESFKPDLIVLDLHLPDSTGVGDIERIKAAGGDVPVLILTSSEDWRDVNNARSHGADDYIVKNFSSGFKESLGFALSRVYDARQLEAEKLRLKREMEVLRVAIENSHDGLAVSSGTGAVRYANRAFSAFAGRCGGSASNIVQMLSAAVNKFEALRESIGVNLRQLPAGASWHTEVTFAGDAAAAFDLSLSVISADGAEDEAGRECVVWVRDVSEIKRREKSLRDILSTTTHDLKGPLGSISLSAELLGDMLERGSRPFEIALRIGSSAQGAINLIDEFLAVRRIQEGALILKPAPHRIDALVQEVLDGFKAVAAAKRIELQQEVGPGCEISVDKLGFCRVLGNLVSNALKFTLKGGRVLVLARMAEDELHLEVQDSGSGMEPSEVQRIFGRYTRLERHGEIEGSGIGLFIVKSIVAAHGGKIEVTSQVGRGTTFMVTFPRNPPVNAHGELISLDFA